MHLLQCEETAICSNFSGASRRVSTSQTNFAGMGGPCFEPLILFDLQMSAPVALQAEDARSELCERSTKGTRERSGRAALEESQVIMRVTNHRVRRQRLIRLIRREEWFIRRERWLIRREEWFI